jgi:hypothetical protein
MKVRIAFCVWLCIACAAKAGDPTTKPAHDLLEYAESPFLAISNGAEVYEGTVLSKRPSEPPADLSVDAEVGQLDFAVKETLRGNKTPHLILPYSFQTRASISVTFFAWPSLDDIIRLQTPLLIVVIPGANDEWAPKAGGASGAVCNVYVLGADDPMVDTYRRIVSASSLKRPDLDKLLIEMAKSSQIVDRQYAEQAAFEQFDTDSALMIIEQGLLAVSKEDYLPEDAISALGYLDSFASGARVTAAQRTVAQRLLAEHAASENESVGKIAMASFAYRLKDAPKPAELLEPVDRDRLLRAANIAAKSPDQALSESAGKILSWLNQGQ